MGSGYTTDQPNDYLGVGFTGVEGYYSGLTGPWTGTYGCSFDGGKTYTNYSAYSFTTSYATLCAWQNLPVDHDAAYIKNFAHNFTLLQFIFSTNGANLTTGWTPRTEEQATSIYAEASSNWANRPTATSSTSTARPTNRSTSSTTTSSAGGSLSSGVAAATQFTSTSFSTIQIDGDGGTVTITSSVPNSSSTSTSSSDVFSLSSPTPYIIGGVVILTIAVLMFVCLYTGFGKNSQEISTVKNLSKRSRRRRFGYEDVYMDGEEYRGLAHVSSSENSSKSDEDSERAIKRGSR